MAKSIVIAELRSGLKVKVGYYTSIEELDKDAGKAGTALHLCNTYMQQKSALPEANAYLVEDVLEKLVPPFVGDPKKNKTVETKDKTGKVTGSKVENTETEGERIKRFVASIDEGVVTYPGITKGQALNWLQAKLDEHGVFELDSKAPVRTSKPKTPPQYCTKAADQVWGGGEKFIKHWEALINTQSAKFGIPTVFKRTGNEAVDKLAFAWAVHARDEAERASKAASEFAAPVK